MCNQPPGPAWINTRSRIRRGIQLPIEVVSQRNRCLRANIEGVSDPYKGCRSGTIAGRMACVLVAALLACASSAHGQVIEEGGFPVKGGGVSGESFSLSCPPRLDARAGESVLLSCSATAVPEEGVRYEWESLSGDGLHLLSDANERSPLFTAPVSEADAEYVYRLTAMSVGVYETATVTVMARGVSGGSLQDGSKSPELLEDCDSFGAFEGFQEGCVAGDKTPPFFEPFEGDPEGEGGPGFLFPEAPGLPDRPSGPVRDGGFDSQTPPRLECPVAVFLEELETGAIECQAWDASGEEYLEFAWEPVGSTTRDYLDNPQFDPGGQLRTPSVMAPEAPVYETLESFHSGETTFRYRYRLTATSRATGLSSWQEVEVFVSSSRPSVYCPLEVVVEEGATIGLDCEGVDPLSHRMDYDEDGASIEWEWEGLWGTSMSLLDATDMSSALFTAPPGSAGKQYHYIASMTTSASGVPRTARKRVTVIVPAEKEATQAAADASALAAKGNAPVVTCEDSETYEGVGNITLDCSVTNEPSGATYAWTTRGSTANTNNLSSTTILKPRFRVPQEIGSGSKDYKYTVTLSASGIHNVTEDVRVRVRHRIASAVTCTGNSYEVEEGADDITFSCTAFLLGPPWGPLSGWEWRWRLLSSDRLTNTNSGTPTFNVPYDIDRDSTWTYRVQAVPAPLLFSPPAPCYCISYRPTTVTVTVRDTGPPAPVITCNDSKVHEGASDFTLDCSVTDEPSGATYAWTARGSTSDTDDLSSTTILKPTFDVPDNVDADTDYEYTVTLSASGISDVTEDVTVTVLEKPDITVRCGFLNPFYFVIEGDGDTRLSCRASGAPGDDPQYTWSWSPTTRLTDYDTATPTFDVPDNVDRDTTWTYTVTASAANAEDGTAEVKVTVQNPVGVGVTCFDVEVYEAADDFTLDCIEFYVTASGFDLEEAQASTTFEWTARGSTPDTDRLSATNVETPTFDVPDAVDSNETYEYTLKISGPHFEDAADDITVTVLNLDSSDPSISCTDSEVYEGAADFTLNCSVANEPSGATYAWTARGSTSDTDDLSSTTILKPTFDVPDDIDETGGADKDYEYTVTLSASGIDDITEDVTVTILEKPDIVPCGSFSSGFYVFTVYEGAADFQFPHCGYTGAPAPAVYRFGWTTKGSTPSTAISLLSATNIEQPFFRVPDAVSEDEKYEYTMTVSADNADPFLMSYTVHVKNKPDITLTCKSTYDVDEGDADFDFDCSASDAPGDDPAYTWSWSPTTNLTDHDTATPTFAVPASVDQDTTYTYTVTATADNAEDGTAEVTVTVRDTDSTEPSLTCTDSEVYEGVADITLDCSVTDEPTGATYAWTGTDIANRLSSSTILKPTFDVPDNVDADTDYDYTVTLSASGIDDVTEDVTVTVWNKPSLALICTPVAPVYEGAADFDLDCVASGDPSGSDNYTYVWTAQGATSNTDLLIAGTDGPTPTFDVPEEVASDETYEYMLTVSADNAEDATANVTVTVLNKPSLALVCTPVAPVYEGAEDFDLDCSASGAPSGSEYNYAWTGRGSTVVPGQLSSTTVEKPTFDVPEEVDSDETYEYTLTVSADNAESATEDITVTVLNKKALEVACATPSPVYEESEDFALDCAASGAPAGSEYAYVWTGRGSTTNTDLLVSGTDGPTPTFDVPEQVDEDETHEYLLTVSAENAEDGAAEVTVKVLNFGSIALICASPPLVYEGSEDFELDCSISGDTGDTDYTYEWTARGATPNTDELSATDIPSPTFGVPDALDETTTYEYLLTVRAANVEDATAEVTVTVLNRGTLAVACAPPPLVYEGSADFALDCTASGAPSGSDYEYVWTARGSTVNTDLLIAGTDGPTPTFSVPGALDETTTYEYLLTVSAENAEDGSAAVTVTVLNQGALRVVCVDPPSVYEGSADFDLDCSASGAPAGSGYAYVWTARGTTANTALLIAGTDGSTPTFSVPDALDRATTYEYLLTVSAENAESGSAEVTVTVLNVGTLRVVCAEPLSVYEGSADFALDCSASGAPAGSEYAYVWTARGSTANTALLIAGTDGPTPTFNVPDALDRATTYEYLLTASAENAESGSAEVTVTVLNAGALRVVCASPASVYEGSADLALDCSASGAPAGSEYAYVWTARGTYGEHG